MAFEKIYVSTYLYVISVISSNQIKICKWMSLKLCCGWHKTFDMSIIIFLLDIFKRTRKEVPPKANGLMMETPRFRFLFHNSFFVFMNKFVLRYMMLESEPKTNLVHVYWIVLGQSRYLSFWSKSLTIFVMAGFFHRIDVELLLIK